MKQSICNQSIISSKWKKKILDCTACEQRTLKKGAKHKAFLSLCSSMHLCEFIVVTGILKRESEEEETQSEQHKTLFKCMNKHKIDNYCKALKLKSYVWK